MSEPDQSADGESSARDPRHGVLVLFSDAGGGHRNAATALLAAAEEARAPLRLSMVGLDQLLGGWDLVRRCTGRSTEETYNELLRRGRTRGLVPLLRLLQGAVALLHRPLARSAARFLGSVARPTVVVSVHPNFNRVLRDAVRAALPGVPFVVLLTDFADFPPRFWIEPGVDRVIAGSPRAVEQALELGLARERVTLTSGMPLHPRFYRGGGPGARARVRAELGLPSEAFVVMVLFGGKGAAEMEPLCRTLLGADPRWHVVAVCGHNPELHARLLALAGGDARLHALGFTERVADLMAAADVLAAKPGPGVLAEAFHQRLPVIVTCNSRTIPQEVFNARLVERQGLGLVVRDWRDMPAAALRLAREGPLLEQVRARLAALPPNRAVYEALDVIAAEAGRAHGAATLTAPRA